jgi:hypothetical protein
MQARLMTGAVLLAIFGWASAGRAAPAPVARHSANKGPLRVLMAGQTGMRDAQFLRSLLVREMDRKKVELALFPQPFRGQRVREGIQADIPPEKILKSFPGKFGKLKGNEEARSNNLSSYDVIVACDLDLERLGKATLLALRKWVKSGGGLVVVAGPLYTPQLAGPAGKRDEGRVARKLLPVVVDRAKEEQFDKPRRLKFNVKDKDDFLKLDSKGAGPLAGWREFFDDGKQPATAPVRGFYRCQPVKSVRKKATVLATLSPATPNGKGEPFLVVMPRGKGRVVYLGSAELWRLREYKEEAHERLWLQLLSYSATGIKKSPR